MFTALERQKCDRRANRAASYARRFAAKEACSKALGTGLRRGVFWRDMGVVNLPSGQPTVALTGGALARLNELLPRGHDGAHRPVADRRSAAGAGRSSSSRRCRLRRDAGPRRPAKNLNGLGGLAMMPANCDDAHVLGDR